MLHRELNDLAWIGLTITEMFLDGVRRAQENPTTEIYLVASYEEDLIVIAFIARLGSDKGVTAGSNISLQTLREV